MILFNLYRAKARQQSLLFSLLFYFFCYPLVNQVFPGITYIFDFFFLVIFVTAAYSIINTKSRFWLALALLVMGIISHTYAIHLGRFDAETIAASMFLGFLLLIAGSLLKEVISRNRVTFNVICGALNVFLLMGIIWGLIYLLIEFTWPGSFKLPERASAHIIDSSRYSELFYFSYVTITTLGYGDITPLSNPARSMALLEAVLGQFYMVVLVARLVGLHAKSSDSDKTAPEKPNNPAAEDSPAIDMKK
ncbi:potassium channel family protein [Dethiosulfatarculus sandiegensis]|uniref:Potassium channel domain-containing protein n=1 Tax=Dethiosulfatarculus sandiegensis TaxID=1429043 RepID=A0A0D2GKG0_9BACT|nr:potassium channel family protein [Dethiosulfatarculus sandiegensis]KIX15252.1 hypothetical protein X474_03325 [Dethiosulfatarculus sandiegensis]